MVRSLIVLFFSLSYLGAEQIYLAPEKFIAQSFDKDTEEQYLRMNPEIKDKVKNHL